MISRRNIYQLSQFACDLVALAIAWYVTVLSRVALNPIARANLALENAGRWAPPLDSVLLVWIGAAIFLRVYSAPIRMEVWTSVRRAAETTVAVLLVTASVMYFASDLASDKSRSFMLIFSPLSFAMLTVSRFSAHALSHRLARKLPPGQGVAVLGRQTAAAEIVRRLRSRPDAIYARGIILPEGDNFTPGSDVPVLGATADLAATINRERLGQILVAANAIPPDELEAAFEVCTRMGVAMSWALFASGSAGYGDDVEIVDFRGTALKPWQEHVKRGLDIAIAASALVVLSPLFLLIAIAIKFDSRGPLLYCSPRVGKGGRYFTFLKFRSMYTDTGRSAVARSNEKDGHIFKIRNDPRITRVGRVLRRYSLDELPQLTNVLRGDMSLVGPRPLPAEDLGPDGMSPRFVIWSKERSGRRPGITGLWQIRGRSRLQFEDMVRCDQEYIRNWSLGLDLIILAKTPLFVLNGDGAF
ncbi:MAG TPA: sugar transferase [Bryobacteraceae bacterium]|nr:sugar transferase [Bryobacteraceae bacterium]